MKKLILATAVAAACISSIAQAQEAAAPVPDNALSFNIGVVNDYRFRGISQTRFDPAVQGGADYVYNPLGLYAGTWLSNIKWIKDGVNAVNPGTGKGGVEMDIYGGKRGDIGGGFTYDVGGLYYYYPNNNLSSTGTLKNANTFEIYGQIGYDTAYFKVSNSLTNAFGNWNSKNSRYYDLSWNPALAGGVILGLHVGHQTINGNQFSGASNSLYSYNDWKVGVSKTFDDLAGITAGIAYVGTDATAGAYVTPDAKNTGRGGVVVSIAKTF
ncbi:hypothetical protein D9O50_06465 [Oxalobacteraceae bacterium CAVE-383]|nr:hypothetical protein D9O50_06465 [Oxalobacteraceae bacterium CAVE-383]